MRNVGSLLVVQYLDDRHPDKLTATVHDHVPEELFCRAGWEAARQNNLVPRFMIDGHPEKLFLEVMKRMTDASIPTGDCEDILDILVIFEGMSPSGQERAQTGLKEAYLNAIAKAYEQAVEEELEPLLDQIMKGECAGGHLPMLEASPKSFKILKLIFEGPEVERDDTPEWQIGNSTFTSE